MATWAELVLVMRAGAPRLIGVGGSDARPNRRHAPSASMDVDLFRDIVCPYHSWLLNLVHIHLILQLLTMISLSD